MNLVIDIRKCPGDYPRVDYPFIYLRVDNDGHKNTIIADTWPNKFKIITSTELLYTLLKI